MDTGNLVKLKNGLKIGKRYGTVDFTKSMEFEGEKKIEIDKDGDILIDGWFYSPEMLEARDST
jgi:hypothetical protein